MSTTSPTPSPVEPGRSTPAAPAAPAARHLRVGRPQEPRRGHLALGEPEGTPDRIDVTSRSLERGGRPWFPVTGEIHYSRIDRHRWDEVLGLARAGGLGTVATYVFWQAHEPRPGEFDWSGNLDLRAFVQLAAEHGLDVVVRMGPWAHGEARYGGFPDWLEELGLATRTNDPEYLTLVRRLFAEQAAQLVGLTHAEGGPVVGLQMDNELYDQPQHLATLRTIAEELGLRVPIWTATGWGGAQVPETLLPLYSAYGDGFWEETTTEWPEFAAFHYRYSPVRDDLSVGKDLRESLDGVLLDPDAVPLKDDEQLPYATCELGGGMHVAYHRRPLMTAADVTALSLAKLGSGSVWQGYYMYAGGTIRRGPWGTSQESHATGYPNDVPTLTYDFYAPIGEFGQLRPHFHALRRQNLWLALDGEALAAMTASVGGGSEDPGELRWAVRSDGERGYVFLTTYQPARRPIDGQESVQVTVELEGGPVTVPSRPVDLPAGVSVAWPIQYRLTDAVTLQSATAALVTRVGAPGASDVVVLAATDGVPAEVVLEGDVVVAGAGRVTREDGRTIVAIDEPGPDCVVELPGVRLLVLDERTAHALSVLDLGGAPRLVLTEAGAYARDGRLVLLSEQATARVSLFPAAPGRVRAVAGEARDEPPRSIWTTLRVTLPGVGTTRLAEGLSLEAPRPPAPTRGGPLNRLSAPTDFAGAARLPIDLPVELVDGADRSLLRVTWTGDVGRAVIGETVVSDTFWHGRVWDVDLTRERDALARSGLVLELLPWRAETGVWVDPSVRDVPDGIHVEAVDVVRVGRAVLEVAPAD